MGKHAAKTKYKIGDVQNVRVEDEHIQNSDPCNKANCMVTRAILAYLLSAHGGKASDYKVKSTNHGTIFELHGRRYIAVFDTKTALRIYRYDQTYRDTGSKKKARDSVKPFTTRIMIESSVSADRGKVPMTEEDKKRVRQYDRKSKDAPYRPRQAAMRRELSL